MPDPHSAQPAPSKRSPAVVAIALLLAVSLAAGASAQVDSVEVPPPPDTFATPVASKDTKAWIQLGGAEYGKDAFPDASFTPVEAEFDTVAFDNDTHGFAGGSACKTAPPANLRGGDLTTYLDECDREPVIYEYEQTETEESWHPVLPPDGSGYVGSIAFMRDGKAIAVGGTGTYPKRELEKAPPGETATTVDNDVAGDARAWLYDDGFWTEIKDDRMRQGMRGLTAVAMSPNVGDCKEDLTECGLAGGYRQMWLWRDGRFVDGWDSAPDLADRSPDAKLTVHAETATDDDSESFRFRVRQIAFVAEAGETKAFAVTSGCCDVSPARNVPAGLVFDGENLWAKEFGAPANVAGDDPAVRRDLPDSLYSFVPAGAGTANFIASPGGQPSGSPEGRGRVVVGNIPQPPGGFPPSMFMPGDQSQIADVALSSLQLTSGAGTGVGEPNWVVGSLGGGQAIAYAPSADNGARQATTVTVLTCPGGTWGGIATDPLRGPPDTACKPYDVPDGYLGQVASKYLYALPSYGLNAIAYTDDTNSVAWAVGDRGALMRLGGIGTTGGADTPPTPAKLGSGSLARLTGSDVYDAFRPMPTDGEVGLIPSLASNGTHEVDRSRLVPAGSPNPTVRDNPSYPPEDVSTVVMSRDGSEGWALGAGWKRLTEQQQPTTAPAPTLYHFDGARWSRCDITGVPGLLPADPACSELGELFGQGPIADESNVIFRYAARVPLENDDDPANNDEFEVFAIGNQWNGKTGQTPLRYQDGHWSVDKQALDFFSAQTMLDVRSVAFTAPNDGWVVDQRGGSVHLFHFDGQAWSNCEDDRARCGDASSRLPLNGAGTGALTTAGKRVYLAASRVTNQTSYPVVLYKDPGGAWTAANGGYDPSCADGAQACGQSQPPAQPDQAGKITSIAVSPDLQTGWAVGTFGNGRQTSANGGVVGSLGTTTEEALADPYYMLRLSGGVWAPWRREDASMDYFADPNFQLSRMPTPVMLDSDGTAAIYAIDDTVQGPSAFLFDPKRERWGVMRTPYHNYGGVSEFESGGFTRAIVPDGAGGGWLVGRQVKSIGDRPAAHFWHYTRTVPNPVFEEAPQPIRESITGAAAGKDGSLWVTTNSGYVYRYDRLTGWDRLLMPGWDRGRIQTRTSEANAVAIGPDGEGVVVGKNGRMAQVSPLGVQLDPAAREVCGQPPCGTARDLRAVDVAPDGSALAGGDASVLLYRPAGGEFRTIPFGGSPNTSITAISMPTADRAWLTNAAGQVYAGRRVDGDWTFFVENRGTGGGLLSRDEHGALLRLNGIEIDQSGAGYAVGARGLVLERSATGGWQRLKTGFLDTFRSVTLAPGGSDKGALIGGDMGLVLTLEDGEFRAAREADLFSPLNYGRGGNRASVLGVAIVPGLKDGEVEAWAVQQAGQGPGAVLHYASDDQPLLKPGSRVEPLPDVPAPRPGEVSFAAFGRSECHVALNDRCGEAGGGNLFNEVVAERVADEITERSEEPGGPAFALFTGDVGRAAGSSVQGQSAGGSNTSLDRSVVHERWEDMIASTFEDAGVPLFGAIGRSDLDRTGFCTVGATCDVQQQAAGGLTLGWRRAMADMPAPWGATAEDADPTQGGGLEFKAVEEDAAAGGVPQNVPNPVVGTDATAPQARTHYAVDVERDGKKIARLIFLDNSMRSLQASDPSQNPIEPDGQLQWLEGMLADVDRAHGQQAVVVMNHPTYSYEVTDATTWATDGSLVEQTLLRYGVKAMVSGRLGWNGRYWTTAPGLHAPCPGGDYMIDDEAPQPGEQPCTQQTQDADQVTEAAEQLADTLQGAGPPPPPGGGEAPPLPDAGVLPDTGLQGLIPTVVAASAGGRFGPSGTSGGEAANGWWHGYTIVRMDQTGNPRATIVEQRPVFDWLSITAASHALKPRQKMNLIGEGREPLGADVPPRYDRINSYAITHRWDLAYADKSNPSLPALKANGEPMLVQGCEIGCIDRQTGRVTAGNGRQARTYTVAILSVGDKAASWPIAFEPAKSFRPVASVAQVPPNPAPLPPATVVLNQGPAPAAPPPPPPGLPQISVPPLNLPPPPVPPNLPVPTATPTPTPPPPPAPPPPPGNAGALPLSLEAPVTPVSIVPTVIPPTPPPVNPAPPSGSAARKEAKQRQAATAKSEEGGGEEGAGETQSSGDNGAAQMTRRDRTRPAPSYGESSRDNGRYSFTALAHSDQPSAWSRGALYGGMTLATALALALGWGIARPTPRRRHPPRPAPNTVHNGRRPGS